MSVQTIAIQNILGTTRNILVGTNISYVVENKKYIEISIILFFPSIYSGYHLYKNREAIVEWLRKSQTTPKTFW
jgi:hypothetical protein